MFFGSFPSEGAEDPLAEAGCINFRTIRSRRAQFWRTGLLRSNIKHPEKLEETCTSEGSDILFR